MTVASKTDTRGIFRNPGTFDRPERLVVERQMHASPSEIYRAWTERLDFWFAAPGSILMKPEVNSPFFFETEIQA
jgi:hypothetical protein